MECLITFNRSETESSNREESSCVLTQHPSIRFTLMQTETGCVLSHNVLFSKHEPLIHTAPALR